MEIQAILAILVDILNRGERKDLFLLRFEFNPVKEISDIP